MSDEKVVAFDAEEFKTLYPQFAAVPDEQLELWWKVAGMLCNNTSKSLVKDLDERKMLLYMLLCHIATLQQRGTAVVGILTAAAEGKVSVSTKPLQNENWYNQTQCGAMYWIATAKYRVGMRYYDLCKCCK